MCMYIAESVYSTPETIVNQLYFNFCKKGKKNWVCHNKKNKALPPFIQFDTLRNQLVVLESCINLQYGVCVLSGFILS